MLSSRSATCLNIIKCSNAAAEEIIRQTLLIIGAIDPNGTQSQLWFEGSGQDGSIFRQGACHYHKSLPPQFVPCDECAAFSVGTPGAILDWDQQRYLVSGDNAFQLKKHNGLFTLEVECQVTSVRAKVIDPWIGWLASSYEASYA